jgi:hypothetical protein
MTLPLTPAELDAIAHAAVALAPGQRVAFAHMEKSELALLPEAARGEGSLHQLIERCQKSFASMRSLSAPAMPSLAGRTRTAPRPSESAGS